MAIRVRRACGSVCCRASLALAPSRRRKSRSKKSVADFYKGKQIRIIVASAAGGGFDLYARYLARHLGKHVPGNPGVIVQNMPGAGGLAASNHMHTRAAKDGLTIGILQGPLTYAQVGKSPNVQFDMRDLRLARQRQHHARTPACSRSAPAWRRRTTS